MAVYVSACRVTLAAFDLFRTPTIRMMSRLCLVYKLVQEGHGFFFSSKSVLWCGKRKGGKFIFFRKPFFLLKRRCPLYFQKL